MAEAILFLAVLLLPLAIGAATTYLSWPWWWGAIVAIALAFAAAIVPEPEEGESRVAGGDLVFLAIVALFVAGLTWLGAWVSRRLRGPRG